VDDWSNVGVRGSMAGQCSAYDFSPTPRMPAIIFKVFLKRNANFFFFFFFPADGRVRADARFFEKPPTRAQKWSRGTIFTTRAVR